MQNRAAVQAQLKAAGIPTVVHYPLPLNRQPAAADPDAHLPVGDRAADEVLSLPMHPYLHDEQIDRIAAAVLEALAGPAGGSVPAA